MDRIKASPLAKALAKKHSVDLSSISKGSGPDNRIVKHDLMNKIPANNKDNQPSYTDIPVSNMRRTIARRLTESKQQIPHYYLTIDVKLDLIDTFKLPSISINDFILKAAGYAMLKCPTVNSVWQGEHIRQYKSVDIAMAVATPDGLITPIVPDVVNKSLSQIHSELSALYEKARSNKLSPTEYQGGTFTVSSLGSLGIKSFTAIINSPQSAILAVGKAEPRVLVSKNGGMEISKVMSVTLSCDHRVVDGAAGAEWLGYFKEAVENPILLLIV